MSIGDSLNIYGRAARRGHHGSAGGGRRATSAGAGGGAMPVTIADQWINMAATMNMTTAHTTIDSDRPLNVLCGRPLCVGRARWL